MIFVTVGSQLPFDRLVRAVDQWSHERGRRDVFAQIGVARFRPRYIPWVTTLDAAQFQEKLTNADVVVSHAGTGSIITALERGKPIVVMPRRADLGETRNDHQFSMARRLQEEGLIRVAFDAAGLTRELDGIDSATPSPTIAHHATPELLATIRDFVEASGERTMRRSAPKQPDSSRNVAQRIR